jgi:hypothetical protein
VYQKDHSGRKQRLQIVDILSTQQQLTTLKNEDQKIAKGTMESHK